MLPAFWPSRSRASRLSDSRPPRIAPPTRRGGQWTGQTDWVDPRGSLPRDHICKDPPRPTRMLLPHRTSFRFPLDRVLPPQHRFSTARQMISERRTTRQSGSVKWPTCMPCNGPGDSLAPLGWRSHLRPTTITSAEALNSWMMGAEEDTFVVQASRAVGRATRRIEADGRKLSQQRTTKRTSRLLVSTPQ